MIKTASNRMVRRRSAAVGGGIAALAEMLRSPIAFDQAWRVARTPRTLGIVKSPSER
jgi:hypothetical protein